LTLFSGWRVALVGGGAGVGALVGAFSLALGGASSGAGAFFSARLANALRL